MQRILIVGAGFGGMWSALAAARLLDQHDVDPREMEVVVIAPSPALVVRPRLYEDDPASMQASLLPLFRATGVRYVQGVVAHIDASARTVAAIGPDGDRLTIAWDRLVLAAGSRLHRPAIEGLDRFAFSIDRIDEAAELDAHLHLLAQRPGSAARDTVAVVGGGFTGIELAAELPARLRRILGAEASPRVVVVEQAAEIGPELGPGPRPVIEQALCDLGVELRLGAAVTAVSDRGVSLAGGEWIEAETVVWTAGVRASPLTAQIDAPKDRHGRIIVDKELRAPGSEAIFVTGDAACAETDGDRHVTAMSCQHALLLGRAAGNNAAADLLGAELVPYTQEYYGMTLDLGPWGAVRTEGWDRVVLLTGAEAKGVKQLTNSTYIYPPPADRIEAFAAARPISGLEARKQRLEALAAALV